MFGLTDINWTLIATLVGLGAGWWLRGQSITTLEADVTAIKQELINLKNLFTPAPAVPVAVVTPVVVHAQDAGIAA